MGRAVRNTAKVILATVYLVTSIALELYHRWVLSPKANNFGYPLAMAMCVRTYRAIAYSLMALGARTQQCQAALYGNTHTYAAERWIRWVPLISLLVVIDAVGMAANAITYRYLSLTLKQVIDSTVPVVLGAIVLAGSILTCRYCRRRKETTWSQLEEPDDHDVAEEIVVVMENNAPNATCCTRVTRAAAVVGIVAGTAMTVWSATADDGGDADVAFGVIVDFSSVVIAAFSILITSYILKQPAWSRFRLLSVTAWPSAIMMIVGAYVGHGSVVFDRSVLRLAAAYALPPAAASIGLAFVGLWILQNTSPLTYSVLSNAIVAGVVVADVVFLDERLGTVNGVGLAVCGIALFVYGWADSHKDEERKSQPAVSLSSDLDDVETAQWDDDWDAWED